MNILPFLKFKHFVFKKKKLLRSFENFIIFEMQANVQVGDTY